MSEAEGAPEAAGGFGGKEQDRFLPIANIARIMRRAVPDNGKIAKDAKESVQECVSEFISFITSEASDKCMKEKRRTINGEDLIWSLGTLGFGEYVEPLKQYLELYRETEGDTKGSKSSDHTGKKEILLNGEPGSSVILASLCPHAIKKSSYKHATSLSLSVTYTNILLMHLSV